MCYDQGNFHGVDGLLAYLSIALSNAGLGIVSLKVADSCGDRAFHSFSHAEMASSAAGSFR